jgi:hypothetical protein
MNQEENNNQENDQLGNNTKPLLTIVFLAPYLPYNLRFKDIKPDYNRVRTMSCNNIEYCIENGTPILRPLSDYSEIHEILEEMNDYEIGMMEDNPDMVKRLGYEIIELMFKNHIDVFGLINFGLAISIQDVA